MNVAEIRMLRRMCHNTRKDRKRNEIIYKKIEVAPIKNKLRGQLLDGLDMCDLNLGILQKIDLIHVEKKKR